MNLFTIIGFILAIGIMITGLVISSDDLRMFLDFPSAFIVCGGSFAAVAISFQLNRMMVLVKIFFYRMIKGQKHSHTDTIREIMVLADAYRKGESLRSLSEKTKDFFLQDGLILLDDGILSDDECFEVMATRNENIMFNYMDEANKMKTVSKFPPAFGMIGTTIGMIVLLANLGGADAMKKIGPAMGVCLITTLYGALLANLIFIPIAENLTDSTKEVYLKNEICISGIKLLSQKANPIVVAERLNSFVKPGDRLNWKEVLQG
jgi:chemotaxis protein MotA